MSDDEVGCCDAEAAHGQREGETNMLSVGEDDFLMRDARQRRRDVQRRLQPASSIATAGDPTPIEQLDSMSLFENQELRPWTQSIGDLASHRVVGACRDEHERSWTSHLGAAPVSDSLPTSAG
jgi:hypothetical protein